MRIKNHVIFLIAVLFIVPLHASADVQMLLNVPGFEGPVNFNDSQNWIEIFSFQFPQNVADEIGIPVNLNSSMDHTTIKFVKAGQIDVLQNAVFSAIAKIEDAATLNGLIAFLEKNPRHRRWKLALCNVQGQVLMGFGMSDVSVSDVTKTDSDVKISFRCELQQWWEKVLR